MNTMKPIYISDPMGRAFRGNDHVFVKDNMHSSITDIIKKHGGTAEVHEVYDKVDESPTLENYSGLILLGGFDIDSRFYRTGKAADSADWGTSSVDSYEIQLIDDALDRGLPVFGICRGMQLINVVFGGTLHSDITHLQGMKHNNFAAPVYGDRAVVHPVEVVGSFILPDGTYQTASSHHQSADRVGAGLTTVGSSPDGIVEMVEFPELLTVGTQWHPESKHIKQDDTLTPILNWFMQEVQQQSTAVA